MHNPPMFPRRGVYLVAFAVVALLGCGGTTDDRPAKWSFISATITEPSCATVNCHSAIAAYAGVDLHERNVGWHALVDRGFVNPMTPAQSPLLYLMKGQGSLRMPPDMPLPQVDIDLIAEWIQNGATNN